AAAPAVMEIAKLKFAKDPVTEFLTVVSSIPKEQRTRMQEIWRIYFECRKTQKLLNTFISDLDKYTVDNRTRTNYILAKVDKSDGGGGYGADASSGGTTTGRLACVEKGTLVDVLVGIRDGYRVTERVRVEDVKEGSKVFSFDSHGNICIEIVEKNTFTGFRNVVAVHWKSADGIQGVVRVTPEHRINTVHGWVMAENLEAGDVVYGISRVSAEGRVLDSTNRLEIVEVNKSVAVPVYDLTVSGSSSFVAGGVCVHNSKNPNLQNLKKDEVLRACFQATDGYSLCELDYDRMEPVVMAVVADCKSWKEIFAEDGHWLLYRKIANDIYQLGIDLSGDLESQIANLTSGVDAIKREMSKVACLAIMYGESPYGTSTRMGIPLEEVKDFFKKFRKAYPEIAAFEAKIRQAVNNGETIYSLFGRARSFPIFSKKEFNKTLLKAMNFPIQSVASDMCIWKLYEVWKYIENKGLTDKLRPINVVHDAIWFEIADDFLEEGIALASRIMQEVKSFPFTFDISTRCSPKVGKDLGHMREFKAA
ncbi:MAG: hypothetical protein KDH96_04710, partial [Candidatus Riesia sp.]|nr:hypothetical protein [Candidatus Riesia sp.]